MKHCDSYYPFFLITVLLFWLYATCSPLARAELAAPVLGFADSLFREEDYLNAAHEYERFVLLFPQAKERFSVEFKIAAAYRNAGELGTAIRKYERLRESGGRIAAYAEMELAETYLLTGDAEKTVDVLSALVRRDQIEDLRPKAELLRAMGEIEQRNWSRATASLRSLASSRPRTDFSRLATDLVPMTIRGNLLPQRSGMLAGLLSAVIPGLGQASNGYWANATWSFLGVSGLGGTAAYYIDQERHWVGIPLALVALAFHVDNVLVARRSARVYNTYHERHLLNEIHTQIRRSGVFRPEPMRFSAQF